MTDPVPHLIPRGLAAAALAVVLLAGCGGSATESIDQAACAHADENGVVNLKAEDVAFDFPCIVVPANTAFTVHLRNLDGTDHNVAIYDSPAEVTTYMEGDTIAFGGFIDYPVEALPAGEYYFECTPHSEMNGPLFVVAGD